MENSGSIVFGYIIRRVPDALTPFFLVSASNFPTPMEEPQKVLRAHYLGAIQVPKPTGMIKPNNCAPYLVSDLTGTDT